MTAAISFITQADEIADQIINIFDPDFKYQILQYTLHDYQGSETYALAEKCKEVVQNNIPYPIVTDIISVNFNALNGLPGTLISSFSSKLNSGEMFRLLEGWEDKSARVVYSLGLLENPNSGLQMFQGYLYGFIVNSLKPHTYGWKACFQPDGYTKPYAELPKNVQMDISECKSALTVLKAYLVSRALC